MPTLDNIVIYGFLLLGFSILVVVTTKKAIKVQRERAHMDTPQFFFDPHARMGWACLMIHFLSMYTFDHRTYFYYPFALIAYGLLSTSHELGAYLLSVFYVFSIGRMVLRRPFIPFYALQKILSFLYILGYSYIFAKRRAQKNAQEPPKNKST